MHSVDGGSLAPTLGLESSDSVLGSVERRGWLRPGTTLGRYVLGEVLGRGGMGTVYAARDPELGRNVALKVLEAPSHVTNPKAWRQRLAHEAQAMARLAHPNVLTIFDIGVADDGRVFLAMELVEGGTLRQWFLREPRHWRAVLAMFLDAGEGLAAAHRAGIVHRDFKPDNILLGADGRPRVTDFGLARVVELADDVSDVDAGAVMGTPGYMAPEQFRGQAIDERTDVFAFCASMYHALYRERPFEGRTLAELANAVANGKVKEASSHGAVPPWLRRVVLSGLLPAKEQRPASMRALLAALRRDPTVMRRRVLAVGAALVGIGVALTVRHRQDVRTLAACREMAGRLDGVWDDARREVVRNAFQRTGASLADEAFRSTRRVVDDYTRGWAAMSTEACEAARIRHVEPEPLYERRRACLEERFDGIRALTDVLANADAKTVRHAVEATQQLEDLSSCADTVQLAAIPLLPTDPVQRRAVEDLSRELQRARALSSAEQATESLAILRGMESRARAAGYPPLLVRWSLQLARRERTDDAQASLVDHEKTILLAEEHRLDRLKAHAQLSLAGLLGSHMGRTSEGHSWMRQATATIARIGNDPALLAMRDAVEGWIFLAEHKHRDAAPLFEQAIEETAEAVVKDVTVEAGALSGLAEARSAEGRYEEAVALNQRALALLTPLYGAHHPKLFGHWSNLVLALLEAGRPEDALATALTVQADVEKLVVAGEIQWHTYFAGVLQESLATVQQRLGHWSEARTAFERALAIYLEAEGPESLDRASTLVGLAGVLREQGAAAEARARIDEAEAMLPRLQSVPATLRAAAQREHALLLLEADPAEASKLVEKARQAGDDEVSAHERATTELAAARIFARVPGGQARAVAAAERARTELARLRDPRGEAEAMRVVGTLRP